MRDLLRRLYSGENDVDFLGARRRIAIVTAVLVVVLGGSLLFRGLSLGIEFEGGVVWEVPQGDDGSTADVEDVLASLGVTDDRVQPVSGLSGDLFRVRGGTEDLARQDEVQTALAELNGVGIDDVSREEVGPSWGDEITEQARTALIWFFVVISAYIAIRFEWRMAIAAFVALVHDIGVSVGVYSLFQFEVTPATVIAFLTILGYSLYDTIVVFDKINDNTALMTARGNDSYGEVVNRSLNQVVMRSINTSITSVLPVASMLLVGAVLLGASALQEFALALLVGILAGSYSSIFIATPVLVALRDRKPPELRAASEATLAVDHPLAGGSAPRPRRRTKRR